MLVDKMKSANKKQQSGRSMIEMIGVLSLMGLITAGAFILISNTNSTQKRNRAIDDIIEISAGIRLFYADRDVLPNFDGDAVLASIGKSKTGPYGESFYGVEKSDTTHFDVLLKGMPESDCQALEMRNWKDAVDKKCKGNDFFITFKK